METKGIYQFLNSYSVKMIVVSGLALILLIPSFLIQDIIRERIVLSEKVKNELYAQWGGKQSVGGPVLNVPFMEAETGENRQNAETTSRVAHFLPELLEAEVTIYPETRKRGIYKTVVYESRINLKGNFALPDLSQPDLQNDRLNWDAAYFTLGISDMRGIRNLPVLKINNREYPVAPGVAGTGLFPSGITITIPAAELNQPFNFETNLEIIGSEELTMHVLGKTTGVSMKSDWPQPAFTGSFLPENREVTKNGFTASWKVTHLNRNFPQQWIDNKYTIQDAELGVRLLIPVDHYQKSMRSAKYAILFIALNFIVFIFIELKSKIKIHPVQYSLVAFALLIFYALLTSISEQIGFNGAYMISALAVTLLITWYASAVLQNKRMAIWIALLQAILYLFLFTILQLNDYALLVGSLGLFVILVIIMRASLQIKWYSDHSASGS